MTELHRGQHPHRADDFGGGGRWDMAEGLARGYGCAKIKTGIDPREFDDKILIERAMWEERTFKSNSAAAAGLPRSRDKTPPLTPVSASGRQLNKSPNKSPNSPPWSEKDGEHVARAYGITTEQQRVSRLAELTKTTGLDKTKLVWQGRVDTTPQPTHPYYIPTLAPVSSDPDEPRVPRIPPPSL